MLSKLQSEAWNCGREYLVLEPLSWLKDFVFPLLFGREHEKHYLNCLSDGSICSQLAVGQFSGHAAGLSALALASRVACKATPAPAALRRQQRLADFERTKQQSLLDAAAVALLGALLLYANNGPESSEGWLLGAVFGLLYLILLQRDVATITVESNPFNLTNPFRILRFLLPFALVVALGLQHASSVGLEEWWQNVSCQVLLIFYDLFMFFCLYRSGC